MSAELEPEVEALALAALGKRVAAGRDTIKAVIGGRYKPGDRQTFRSPLDQRRLGQVYRTDPDPEWRVTDPAAFEAHLRAYPGNLEEVAEIDDVDGAVAYLTEHAPQFLAFVSRVTDEARAEAMAAARAGDEVPGVSRVYPDGVLTVKPDPDVAEAIAALIAAGRLTWDGRVAVESAERAS